MTDSPPASAVEHALPPRRSRFWLWLAVLLGIPTFAVLLLVIVVTVKYRQHAAQVQVAIEQEIARIKAAGEPFTREELAAFQQPPPGTPDTTRLWIAAVEAFQKEFLAYKTVMLPGLQNSPREIVASMKARNESTEDWIESHTETMQRLSAAAEAVGEIHLGIGAEEVETFEAKIASLDQFLSVKAIVSIERGDVADTLNTLRMKTALIRTLDRIADLQRLYFRASMALSLLEFSEDLARDLPLSEGELAELQQILATIDFASPTRSALLAERVNAETFFHDATAIRRHSRNENQEHWGFVFPDDRLFYLESMRDLLSGLEGDYQDAWDGVKASWARNVPLAENDDLLTNARFSRSKVLISKLWQGVAIRGRLEALFRAFTTALAGERFFLRQGRFPTAWSELTPDLLSEPHLDPYDNQPLRMRADGDEWIVYSIGHDFKDDGGDGDLSIKSERPDIVARVRPMKTRQRMSPP